MKMQADLRDMLRYFANRADPAGDSKGTDADLMRQAANKLDEFSECLDVLTALHGACADAYKAGRVAALPFIHAGNVLAKHREPVQ